MTKFRRALVTGGAGFIGSHIVDALLERNVETIVIDNFSTGSINNLSQHKFNPLLRICKGDIRRINQLLKNEGDIDVVFHEAAIASVSKSVSDPMSVHDANVNSALEVMNFCVKKEVSKLVFASSAAVYGIVKERFAKEEMHCLPYSPYGASKMCVENYLSAYHQTYGLSAIALRYFNAYGPRQKISDYSGVITIFVNKLLHNTTPTVFGDGGQTRDFVHVRDIVQANMLAVESRNSDGEAFNVASGESISVLGLFEILREIIGVRGVSPNFSAPRKGDVRSGLASIEKIQKSLGYVPSVSLRQGLEDLVNHVKTVQEAVYV